MIRPVLSLFLILTMTLAAHAQSPRYFAPTDSNAQANWSYAAVHFRQAKDLAKGLREAKWNEKKKVYVAKVPNVGTAKLTSSQQCMVEGNAIHTARIWTADQDYAALIIETKLQATVTVGIKITRIDGPTQTTQPAIASLSATKKKIEAANGTSKQSLNAIIRDVHQGDRICFLMNNTGDHKGSHVLQTWNLKIIALAPLSHHHP